MRHQLERNLKLNDSESEKGSTDDRTTVTDRVNKKVTDSGMDSSSSSSSKFRDSETRESESRAEELSEIEKDSTTRIVY